MAEETRKPSSDEMQLATALLGRKLITEGQLKAALDYQRSLGVRLSEALVRLSILRPAQLEGLLAGEEPLGGSAPPSREGEAPDEGVLDPAKVSASELKVHKKLLAKLPRDLVTAKLLVLFFPPPGVSQRKIVLGHAGKLEPEVANKVRSIVGVDVVTLELDREVAVSFLAANGFKVPLEKVSEGPLREAPAEPPPPARAPAPEAQEAPSSPLEPRPRPGLLSEVKPSSPTPPRPSAEAGSPGAAQPPSSSVPNDFLVQALVGLLAKKGIITREELEMEVELARIRKRAGSAVTVAP